MLTAADIRAVKSSLCRESFRDFIRYVKPDYFFNWHHEILIEALQTLADRREGRLIVSMPPRHGKSELVSRLFPAWMLARNPNEQIIAASYSADLAGAMNRDCQRIMTGAVYADLFAETKLSDGETGTVRNSKRFDVVGHRGYYVSAGVGGGITGVGCTVGIIDDPVKNAEEADSPTYREKAWEWYTSTFKTRFEPGCIEVICQTRWHEDDLTGRVLKRDGGASDIVLFPAIAESAEPMREIGAPLWETKYNLAQLRGIQKEVGTRTWNALYQQRPAAPDGGILQKKWFRYYEPGSVDFSNAYTHFYFDTAYTKEEKNDPTAGIAYKKVGADFYILEVAAEWVEFTEALQFIQRFCMRNGASGRSVARVEPKASGKSLVQVLRKQTTLNIKEADVPKEDKVARANSAAPTVEGGRVFLPAGAPWVPDFLAECAAFPNGAHDDRVDCLTGMIKSERPGLLAR